MDDAFLQWIYPLVGTANMWKVTITGVCPNCQSDMLVAGNEAGLACVSCRSCGHFTIHEGLQYNDVGRLLLKDILASENKQPNTRPPDVEQSKKDCTILAHVQMNGVDEQVELSGLIHLIVIQHGGYGYWFGMVDVASETKRMPAPYLLTARCSVFLEDGRGGNAQIVQVGSSENFRSVRITGTNELTQLQPPPAP